MKKKRDKKIGLVTKLHTPDSLRVNLYRSDTNHVKICSPVGQIMKYVILIKITDFTHVFDELVLSVETSELANFRTVMNFAMQTFSQISFFSEPVS